MRVARRKPCKDCSVVKPLRNFYRHPKTADGYEGLCKACKRRYAQENRELKATYYRAREAERAGRPERIAARRAYDKSPGGKAAHVRANRVYRAFKALESRA